MAEKCFIWCGYPREVFKPGVPIFIERGIPLKMEDSSLFLDLFEGDPNFAEISPSEASKLLKEFEVLKGKISERIILADKTVEGLKTAQEKKLLAWYKRRDEFRAARKTGGGK